MIYRTCTAIAALLFALPVVGAELRILPGDFTLWGNDGRQRIAVVAVHEDQLGPLIDPSELDLQSSDPEVVRVEQHVAVAAGNGEAKLIATHSSGAVAQITVRVADFEQPAIASFRHDVQNIFSKLGCNSGACHGALAGKGGFRLSLRGYDADADFQTITREARGRRVEPGDPGRSMILAKPTGALPHKGGLLLDPASRDYQQIAAWIAAGTPAPSHADPTLNQITVSPATALLAPADQSQILVQAHYDDGRVRDVTHWAKFTATDEAVAAVDEVGRVTVRGSGEGAVLVWFGSHVALARMTVPYPHKIFADTYAAAPRRNIIDQLNLAQLETLRLAPSPRCDDETFIRRSTLDCVGRLPTLAERDAFFNQPESRRRDWWIEQLLAGEDFVDYWAYKWSDLLLINGNLLRPAAVESYYRWVHDAVRQNKPWDQLVREILTATGVTTENGATNFYSVHQTPEEMTENACQAFMGLSIGCAKCHNHPLEKWTNDQYYAMANLFARVRAKGWGGDSRNGDGVRTILVADSGDLIQPSLGRPQPPAPLDAEPLPADDPRDRRAVLADWMTDPANPYFARAIANRVWANFMGRGLIEPVDDLRLSNPAACEPLLSALADLVSDAGFDLKQLMRVILQSETYQRSSLPLVENREEAKYFSRYYPRRLMAEVLLDAIDQVLGTSTRFDEIAFSGADRQQTNLYPDGTRAIELYDSAVSSYFLKTFGRNPREITCECERSSEPSLVQVLHLSNGDTLNPKLTDTQNVLAAQLAAGADDPAIIRQLFLAALSRPPTDSELTSLLEITAEYGDDRDTALQDVAWSVLTSSEFTFNR